MRKIPPVDEHERGIARSRATPGASRSPAADAPADLPDEGSGHDEPRLQLEAPAISLPKGGGASRGIDEKFGETWAYREQPRQQVCPVRAR